ncbi:MAG TPA: NADP-dependent malic enzyme [Vicinamibacteria bacterium]|nr:NADP-dependent malic enzyme [Vicinamibacteria bacterium]
MIRKQEALDYHSRGRRGKIEIRPTKPTSTQHDLSLAYSPGVAEPCLEIHANPEEVFTYTTKANLVGVVSNGTAVLGLGNIGPLAAKPVMEGKGVLFKRFADIDVFDIELATSDPDELIRVVKALEPTFGGINLEDIKAPDCFYIEETLKQELDIPVFHDDQHGTAIISGAALLNWLEITEKDIAHVKVVINGAGAAGIACAELIENLGVAHDNIVMCDSKGIVYRGRSEGMNRYKERYAVSTRMRSLEDAMAGADVFMGVSVKDAVSKKMVASMNARPLVMAMANPDPEISWDDAMSVRDDLVMATGRSDYPNQVNNVLGFPFIFRGALDVRARAINMEMKMAATRALAELAREDVPDSVMKAYGVESMRFGPNYIIPTPFDSRVLTWEASAVAKAAMETGVARIEIDIDAYREKLEARLGRGREVMRYVLGRAKQQRKRIVFPEGEEIKILRASQRLVDEGIASPILLGRPDVVTEHVRELGLDLNGVEIVDPAVSGKLDTYLERVYALRARRGVTRSEARELLLNRNMFGCMMVESGDADAMVAGLTQHYPDTIRPALQVVRVRPGSRVAGVYMMVFQNDIKFFADTTVTIEPTADDLCEIAMEAAEVARRFNIEPRVAMLSFSNFGSVRHALSEKVRRAVELLSERAPDLLVDGEMQADTAVVPEILTGTYPFSRLKQAANVLVFPSLEAGNIAYKLIQRLGDAKAVGPILVGLSKPVHVLQRGAEVDEIVDMAAIAAVDAQSG